MRKVQFWQREMARIAEPIDPDNDPFSQLFDTGPVDSKPDPLGAVPRPAHNRMSTMSVSVLSVVGVLGIFGAGYLGGEIANNWFSVPAEQKALAPVNAPIKAPVKPAIISKKPTTTQVAAVSLNRDPLPVPPPRQVEQSAEKKGVLPPLAMVRQGVELVDARKIPAAREMLQAAFTAGETDAALALGRSFDPRVVGIENGDPAKALDWYEKWYLAAVKAGSVSPKVRVDRLFAPLRRTGQAGVKP